MEGRKEEQVKKAKIKMHDIKTRENELVRLKEVIELNKFNIKNSNETLELIEKEQELAKVSRSIILDNFYKNKDKCDFKWELSFEYWTNQKELQIIQYAKEDIKTRTEVYNLKNKIKSYELEIETANTQIDMINEELSELKQ